MQVVKNKKCFESVQHSNDHISVPSDVPEEYILIWLGFAHQLTDKYRYYRSCELTSVTVSPLWLIFTGMLVWQGYSRQVPTPMMVHFDRVSKVYQLFTWVNLRFEEHRRAVLKAPDRGGKGLNR